MQSASATQAPVIEAVRVPPSACSTSQSTVIWRSPSASRSSVARSERPIRRWISTVRPFCLPAEASRRVRSSVARGSMPYSAVTQPRPWPLSQGGSRSSSVAVTSTWVSPNLTMQEPSAYLTTPRSSDTARSSSGARRLGRMGNPPRNQQCCGLAVLVGGGSGQRQGLWPHSVRSNGCLSAAPGMDKIRAAVAGVSMVAHHDPIGLIAPHAGLAQLNERSRDIFRQIVESYLATGEPVGSRNISRLIAVPLSPASVRNVMSDLEQLGLIYAPHTSAGRLPTELGLRFFVDALMQVGDLTEPERQSIQTQLASVGKAQSVEAALGRGLDAAVRPDPGRGGGAHRQIQFAAEAYRIRAAGAGAGAGGAGRRGWPGREPRADAAAGRSLVGADRSHQFSQCADPGANAGGGAPRT